MNLDQIPWYIPSLYGDVRLTAQGSQTEIEWENLSPTEREALTVLGKKFDFEPPTTDVGKIVVAKPIARVEATLARAMKRGRKLLSAVVFKNGSIQEIHRVQGEPKPDPFRDQPEPRPAPIEKAAAAAVTVAQPMIGCPVPEFERAEVRATRVLRAFLSERQLADFERTQSFLVTGADTGRQYLLTSRQASAERLGLVAGRSVFDVAAGQAICVHDWVVPAAEELLELKLFLELPGREAYVRALPETWD